MLYGKICQIRNDGFNVSTKNALGYITARMSSWECNTVNMWPWPLLLF